MNINYKINESISVEQFQDLLAKSTLGARRPIDDAECLAGMLANSNLTVTAWTGERLIGIARSITDFHYACYLSDLAIDQAFQKSGIGKQLQVLTQAQLNSRCKLILISAPAANSYYEKIGYVNNPRCWVLDRTDEIKS